MSQPIDLSYVEIRSRGEDDAAKNVRGALEDMERDVRLTVNEIERMFRNMADSIEREMERLTRAVEREIRAQKDAWGDLFDSIGRDASENTSIAEQVISDFADNVVYDLSRIDDEADRSNKSLLDIGESAAEGLTNVGNAARNVTQSLTQLGSTGGGGGAAGILKIAAASTVAIPAVLALGGAALDLVGFIGLLPAAVGSFVAVSSTLKLAFEGVGEAVKALASGDLEKIKAAMEELSPSAQKFARELNALQKPLTDLRKTVQESFFSQFKGDLTELANVIMPVLKTGLGDVGKSLGGFAAQILELLGSQDILEVMSDIFQTTADIIEKMAPVATDLFGVIFGLVEAGLPHLEDFADYINQGLVAFTKFLSGSLKSGSFNDFITNAVETFKELVELGGAFGRLIGALFGETGDEGRSLIQVVTDLINKFTEFVQSAEGQQGLQDTLDTLKSLGSLILTLTGWLIAAAQWFQRVKNTIADFGGEVADVAVNVGEFFVSLWEGIKGAGETAGGFFTQVGEFFSMLGQKIVDAWNTVVAFGGQIVTFFQELPGKVLAFISTLPELISGIFVTLFDKVTYAIGFGLGAVIRFFIDLPGNIYNAIVGLIELVTTVFTNVWNTATTWTTNIINSVISFFSQLPGRIYNAIVRVIEFVRNVFTNVLNTGISLGRSFVSNVISIITQVPGKVFSALSAVPGKVKSALQSAIEIASNIGRDIMNGIKRGIENGVGAVIEIAKRAARNIIQGMMDALWIGSPSRLAERDVGINLMDGVGVGVRKGVPDVRRDIDDAVQAFMPSVTNVMGMGTQAGQAVGQAFTLAPGAINVTIDGSVTPAEAQAIGAGIGRGVMSTLARQTVRTQIRAI